MDQVKLIPAKALHKEARVVMEAREDLVARMWVTVDAEAKEAEAKEDVVVQMWSMLDVEDEEVQDQVDVVVLLRAKEDVEEEEQAVTEVVSTEDEAAAMECEAAVDVEQVVNIIPRYMY